MMASLPVANDSQNPGESKNTTTATNQLHPPEQSPKCPRCDSSNTKFCYYNNYSLTQPRHFCKTCRRYWTKGGALRNVPVGGGCRKSKKSKSSAPSSSSSSSSSSSRLPLDPFIPMTSIADPNSGGLKFFNGLGGLPFSTLHNNQFISFGDLTPTKASSTSMVGFNYPSSSAVGVYSEMGSSSSAFNNSTHHSSLASSIESLSSINQDLHWKLQQQRLAMLTHKESSVPALPAPLLDNQQDPISFQVTESFRAEVYGNSGPGKGCASDPNTTTAWFLDSPYTLASTNINTSSDNIVSNWNGIPTWNDMHHFTTLP